MHVKGKGLIKTFLIVFIVMAVYLGHKDFFNQIPGKVKDFIPNTKEENASKLSKEENQEMLNLKFSSQKQDSFIGKVVSGTLNKILETPNGREVLKEVLQKMMRQSHEIAGQDLFLSRYLVRDISVGKGREVICGDHVDILYAIIDPKNLKQKRKKIRKTVVIGDGTISINLETGIIAMKEGGVRSLAYPNMSADKTTIEKKNSNAISAVVELIAVKNKKPTNKQLGKPFFNKIAERYLSGIKLICGDVVEGSYTVSDLKGNILYDSKKSGKNFSFRIGSDKIPSELSNAIIGLPAHKASVSFVALPVNIRKSFSKIKNFLPSHISIKEANDPVILNFKLKLTSKI